MSPSAPAQAKSFTPDMHTCIIVAPHGVHASAGTYRVITTTKTPPSEFGFGKLVELGSEKRGSLGTWRVVGLVNIFTMQTLGYVRDYKMLHWVLK